MEFHEAANIFPLDEEHLAELAADIKQYGLKVSIETLDGKILDGRRRFKACAMAGIQPRYLAKSPSDVPDPVAHVLSLNYHRRHLSPTQWAMVGARARQCYDERAKERQAAGQKSGGRGHTKNSVESLPPSLPDSTGKARDAVGDLVGVSGKTIDAATRVLKNGTPALIAAVDADHIAVSTAAKASTMPEAQQDELAERAAEAAAKGKGPRPRPSAVAEEKEDEPEAEPNGEVKGVGVSRAHEAINSLIRIPKNDALRKQGFRLVSDWIKRNP